MAKNKLMDLNDNLFEAMERLNDNELMQKNGEMEIQRARAITGVGKEIINNARLILDAQKHADEYGYSSNGRELPRLLDADRK